LATTLASSPAPCLTSATTCCLGWSPTPPSRRACWKPSFPLRWLARGWAPWPAAGSPMAWAGYPLWPLRIFFSWPAPWPWRRRRASRGSLRVRRRRQGVQGAARQVSVCAGLGRATRSLQLDHPRCCCSRNPRQDHGGARGGHQLHHGAGVRGGDCSTGHPGTAGHPERAGNHSGPVCCLRRQFRGQSPPRQLEVDLFWGLGWGGGWGSWVCVE
jgi:hypothetical protein